MELHITFISLFKTGGPIGSSGYASDNAERSGIELFMDRSSSKRELIYCYDEMLIKYILDIKKTVVCFLW